MGIAEIVRNAREGLQIWEETHLKDVRDELDRMGRAEAAAAELPEPPPYPVPSQHAAGEKPEAEEPATAEAPRDAGGKFASKDPG